MTSNLLTAEQRLLEAIAGIDYKNPGSGAIEYARTFTVGQSFSNAMPTIQQIMGGHLHDPADKRVKRCAWCNYFYRDRTRPNMSVVCSPKCRNLRKADGTRIKNAAKPKKPKKPNARQRYYYDHYEYPFWTSIDTDPERIMLSQTWKYEVTFPTDKVERIIAAKKRGEEMNGRKKTAEIIEYDGGEGTNQKVYVKFPASDRSE